MNALGFENRVVEAQKTSSIGVFLFRARRAESPESPSSPVRKSKGTIPGGIDILIPAVVVRVDRQRFITESLRETKY